MSFFNILLECEECVRMYEDLAENDPAEFNRRLDTAGLTLLSALNIPRTPRKLCERHRKCPFSKK